MNELLLWLSVRRSGSAQSFRRQAALLADAPIGREVAAYRLAAWNLSKLGHAEFDAAAGTGWRIAPPVLATNGIKGPFRAVLCGARTPAIMETLVRAAGDERVACSSQARGPDTVGVSAESASALADIACQAGLPLQPNAPLAILAAYPFVHQIELEARTIPVGAGWTVNRFSKTSLAWVDSSSAEAQSIDTGFFRFRGDYGTTYVLRERGRTLACDAAVGKFRILMRRHKPIVYSPHSQEMAFAASCRPPELVERALVVASGRLPEFRSRTLVYACIEREVAAATAAILGQRLY